MVSRSLSNGNTNVIIADQQRFIIQVIVTCMASLSITASLLALYWFCLMRRNYRRDLVLMLILSDCFKNFCYILFSAVQFSTNSGIRSGDDFCQASGYMLQTSIEACDFAILFISLHMALQIFPFPNTVFGYDGLYNVRYWVFAIWIIVPNVTASLAFASNTYAYAVQGAWCWLPIRPFWYRLALAWIPRYIITIVILSLAITIYAYVGQEFKIFRHERDRASSRDFTTSPESSDVATTRRSSRAFLESQPIRSAAQSTEEVASPIRSVGSQHSNTGSRRQSVIERLEAEARRNSLPVFNSPFDNTRNDDLFDPRKSRSATASRRGSRQVTFETGLARNVPDPPLSPTSQPHHIGSIASMVEDRTEGSSPMNPAPDADVGTLPPIEPARTMQSMTASSTMDDALRLRRRAIKRQVRGLFIYPVAYISFWILPFVYHCMNYSDYYATHPVFALSILASWCPATLGLVDASIFCFRERPWRHIPGSDGTFIGSLMFWRFVTTSEWSRRPSLVQQLLHEKDGEHQYHGFFGFVKSAWRRLSSGSPSRSPSSARPSILLFRSSTGGIGLGGGADRDVRVKEIAQERLRRERQEFEERQARASFERQPEPHSAVTASSTGPRNWFDRELEIEDSKNFVALEDGDKAEEPTTPAPLEREQGW